MSSELRADVQAIFGPWDGPYGGWPPFDVATPELIEQAVLEAIEQKRVEVAEIAGNSEPPTFENTIEALEDSGRALQRANSLRGVFVAGKAIGAMLGVEQRLAPLLSALDDEIAHNDLLFARIEAVWSSRTQTRLAGDQLRLTEVIRDRMLRRGAGLGLQARARLSEINARLALLISQFGLNLIAEENDQVVFADSAEELTGLSEGAIAAAANAAAAKGKLGRFAIANTRPGVWPILTSATNRDLRHRVWRQWVSRGANDGPNDNRPIMSEILSLRGEKARLLNYPSFAHFATAPRMAMTPQLAMDQMLRTWAPVLRLTKAQLIDMQRLADADGLGGPIQPWDRYFYAERLRQTRFGLDASVVKPYLEVDCVLNAILHAAGRLHGLTFRELKDAPVLESEIRVIEANRDGETVGVIWFDLMSRKGKSRGSFQLEYRPAESFRGKVICFSGVYTNLERETPDGPVTMSWPYVNVLFHEFGHALHMILSAARYPSLGSMGVAWDTIEVPSLLNERWLYDRELLRQFLRHSETGEPIPDDLIEAIEEGAKFDRVFSLGLDYLCGAIIDMRMHLEADGREVDALAVEQGVRDELGMPDAIDLTMRAPHFFHAFTEHYAAGVYAYLWADVMAADIAEAFTDAPGGLYDGAVAKRWRDDILSAGNSTPPQEAFRNFRGRDPDPTALLRRFQIA